MLSARNLFAEIETPARLGNVLAEVLAACVVLGWVALAVAADEDRPISATDAVKRVGKTVRVEMQVKKAKNRLDKHGLIYLDSEDDFHSPTNLGVAISPAGVAKFRALGIADPTAHFLGKSIRVRGEILVFETRPYLPVTDPAQIEIVTVKK
jgi:hypothetical protein